MRKLHRSFGSKTRNNEIRVPKQPASHGRAFQVGPSPHQASRTKAIGIARLNPLALTPQDALYLQSATGNQAMGRLFAKSVQSTGMSAQSAQIQRWGAGEHEILGAKGSDHRSVELAPGYSLSFGEV